MTQGNGSAALDVLGMGNAIVDVLARADDAFIAEHDLPKGGMTLIDDERADQLYEAMGRGVEVSGGSCANTMAGAASFGSRAAYVGKVRDDQLGAIFAHDIRSAGRHVRDAPGRRRRAHGPLPDPGDPRRPAHHVHVPGRLRRPGAGGR